MISIYYRCKCRMVALDSLAQSYHTISEKISSSGSGIIIKSAEIWIKRLQHSTFFKKYNL